MAQCPQYPSDDADDPNARAIPTIPQPRREDTTGGGRAPQAWHLPHQGDADTDS